jgi:ATP-dependent Clp protease ATP-binding subunit ClpX
VRRLGNDDDVVLDEEFQGYLGGSLAVFFAYTHQNLVFEDAALDYIVDKAIEFKLGARGLRSLTETIMMDLMYEIPSQKDKIKHFVVTKQLAEQKLENADTMRLRSAI